MPGIWDSVDQPAGPSPDKPWYNDAAEVGRQVAAGAAVDLPRMAGQAARWIARDGSPVDDWGRRTVESADERAPGWEPDMEGRGALASTLIKGGRAIAPMAPAIAASMVPGGQWIGPAVAAGQFGASSAQDTEDKLRLQGIDDATATRAGWNTGLIQGPLEGAATAVGARAFTAARPLLGIGSGGAAGAVARATDTRVLKPLAKGMALNLVVQPTTEVLQDVGTELNERAYGAAPEDIGAIAKDSAQGALGLTLLLGPFAGASHVSRARRNQAMKDALFDPATPEAVRNQARDLIVERATREGVSPQDMDGWLDQQFALDDARIAADAADQADQEALATQRRIDAERGQAANQRIAARDMAQSWNGGAVSPAQALSRATGTDSAPMGPAERAAYEQQFAAAANERSGLRVNDENGLETELNALEAVQRRAGLATLGEVPADPTAGSQGVAAAQSVLEANAQAVAQAQQAAAMQLTPEQQRLAEVKQQARQVAQAQAQRDQRAAADFGITKPAALATYGELEDAHTNGLLDDQQFATAAGMLAGNATGLGKVRQTLGALRKDAEAARLQAEHEQRIQQADAQQAQADAARLQERAAAAPAPAQTASTAQGAPTPAPAVFTAAKPASSGVRRVPKAVAPPPQVAAEPKAAPAPTVLVGRAGRRTEVTKDQLAQTIQAAPQVDRARIADLLGADLTTNPDTGAPMLVQVRNPRTFDEVAALESERTGKTVSRQAIQQALAKYGITKDVVDRASAAEAATNSVSEEELGIDLEANGSGFRVEDSLSKTTGQGLVDDGNRETVEEKRVRLEGDRLLKLADMEAKPAAEQEEVDEFSERRRALAAEETYFVVSQMVATPEGQAARTDWDDMKADSTPAFDNMPDGYKLEWIDRHAALTEEHGNDYQPFQDAVNDLERDFAASPAGSATAGSIEGVQAAPAASTRPEEGAGGRPADAGRGAGEVRQEVARPQLSAARAGRASTVAAIRKDLGKLMPINSDRLVIVQSIGDLPANAQQSLAEEGPAAGRVQGFVLDGRAYLVADNIQPGNARAVFLHEVGSHMGMEDILSTREFMRLVRQVRTWADSNDGSQEAQIAQRAVERVGNAGTQDEQVLSELVAYFVEEAVLAGVNPTALDHRSAIGRWMQALVSALKTALRKLGVANPADLTAQDVVNLAYGAAHVALQEDARADAGAAQLSVAIDRLPAPARQAHGAVAQALRDVKSKALLWGSFTRDLAAAAARVLPSATEYVRRMEASAVERTRSEREIERVLDMYDALPAGERGARGLVNGLIKDSTMKKAWAFKPEYVANAAVDPQLAERFKKLSTEGQALVQAVFKHGHDNLVALKKAVNENVASEFDTLIRTLTDKGDTAGAAKAEADKIRSLKEFETLNSLRGDWPYAPLKRFGNHVVVGMSQAYLDAEKANDRTAMDRLKEDANHYFVAFRDTRGEARKLKEDISRGFAYADNFEKDQAHEQLFGGRDVLGAFRRLRDLVEDSADSNLSSNASAAMSRLMTDLHLTLLGEQSARQAERNRRGIAGADDDMMRAFATQGRAMAHYIASLKANGEVQDQLQAMKREADARTPGREERRDYYNELLKRHVMGLDYKPTPLIDRALTASSFWLLLTSPAHYLTNATQTMVVSLPSIAGRHGYAKSAAALLRAYADVLPIVRDGKLQQDDYSALPADVRNQVQQLTDEGAIDISLESDLGRWRSDSDNKAAALLDRTLNKLRNVSQAIESVNRLTTAIAAVRLERETGSGNEVKYAGKVIYDTHGDYSGFNAPRLMRTSAGRMATQFRKFQLIQISLYAKLLRDAFKGASADERLVARKTLAFNLTHMMAVGGLLGLPGAALFGQILGMAFGDDDDPDNAEQTLRRLVGDEVLADLLTKGVPKAMGLDLSGRIGAGNMLSIQPFADGSISREGYSEYVVAMLGPFLGGLLPRAADGIDQMGKGNVWAGMEMLLPKGFADASKALRYGTEGVTNRRGDVLMRPEDVSWGAHVGQLIGLPTTQLTDRSANASAAYKADQHFTERSARVKADYTRAYRANDTEAMQEARSAWVALQAARTRNGYKAQPLSELLKAPRAQQQRERNTVNGVQFTRANQGMVEQLTR